MLDVTGFVLTQNNERTLKACLDSLYWCDEIIVVDSFSTDTTEAIAKTYPKVRFLQHEYENYMEQRIWGIPHVQTKWTFTLDSDEVCSDPLREKIIEILKSGDETHDGYLFLIRTQIFGKLLKHQDLLSSRGKASSDDKHATRYWAYARVHAQLSPLDNKKEMPAKYYIIHNPIGSSRIISKDGRATPAGRLRICSMPANAPVGGILTLRPVGTNSCNSTSSKGL
jgi:glycosyltransferase involved in cell wall biosynthesis